MFSNETKKNLEARVKYQQPQFKQKLARARNYQRPAAGSFAAGLSKWTFIVRRLNWRIIGISIVLLGAAWYVSFVQNAFFIKQITVNGGSESVKAEVRAGATRFLEGRYGLFPRRNLLFTPKNDLAQLIPETNLHVWKVDAIKKKWPNTLEITISPREPRYLWRYEEQQLLVANDGRILPLSELKDQALLQITGPLSRVPPIGEPFSSEEVVRSLAVIADTFIQVTGLPLPTTIALEPILASAPEQAMLPATASEVMSTEPLKPLLLDAPARELRLFIPAVPARGIRAFVVMLDVRTTSEALSKLAILLNEQSPDRLASLAYVDVRFINKAFICLASASCAVDTPAALQK